MSPNRPSIEYIRFMNWLQNNCPGLYTQYWRDIEPDGNNCLQVKLLSENQAVLKKLEQATGEYLTHLRSDVY